MKPPGIQAHTITLCKADSLPLSIYKVSEQNLLLLFLFWCTDATWSQHKALTCLETSWLSFLMVATSSTPLRRQAVSMHLSIDTLTTSWTIHSYSIELAYQRYRSMTMALCQTGIVCIGHCAFTLLASSPDWFFYGLSYYIFWRDRQPEKNLVWLQLNPHFALRFIFNCCYRIICKNKQANI